MHVDATTRRRDGVTLVELQVHSDRDAPRSVRVQNRLDGPVWYPRRHGDAAAGWDDGGYEGTIPADGRLALGYASPAPPADPPAELVSVSTVDDEVRSSADVVADLGDPRPPRDAVDTPSSDPVPGPVAAWLDGVASGRRDARTEAALDAVAERVDSLRRPAESR